MMLRTNKMMSADSVPFRRCRGMKESVRLMEDQKQDRRVKKTKAAIHKAFFSLLNEKEYSEITVKDLAEAADISRKTFYLHYGTLDDVLLEILDSQMRQETESMRSEHIINGDGPVIPDFDSIDYTALFYHMIHYSENQRSIMKKIMSDSSSRHVIFRAISERQMRLQALYEKHYDINPDLLRLFVTFMMYGSSAMYMKWRTQPNPISIEEYAKATEEILRHSHALLEEWRDASGDITKSYN